MAPKISSPYANSKDPNMGMHEADPNMSINRARFYQVTLSPQVMQGAKKELAETCQRIWLFEQNRLIMAAPRPVGALDAEMMCWMVHVVEEWLNEWISSHWEAASVESPIRLTFFIDESWIP